ncbi:MAG: TraR/DksA family transcriptional regulator [Planctomycetota bacterium]|nr:TraR/DksA family transcriptional regulator [Planctomycetota bacterium]
MVKKPSTDELDRYRAILLRLRQEVSGDIGQLEEDAFPTDGERVSVDNLADIGSDSFAQEFSLELLEKDGETLGMIDAALERLQAEKFGRCEVCESWIPRARLQAMPYAPNCIACQREAELEG